MNILIDGGMGFVGSHTVQLAVEKGHTVSVIDNESTGYTKIKGAKYYKGSITEPEFLARAFREINPQVVIHLAAQPSLQTSIKKPQFDAKVNIIGTINVAEKCREYGAKIVFSSTSAVYKAIEGQEYTEQSDLGPLSPYGCAKFSAEKYIQVLCDNWVILRYGNVYGPRQVPIGENQFVPRAIQYIMGDLPEFVINGDGEQKRDLVYVCDVAKANLKACMSERSGIYNIGTGRGTEINTIFGFVRGFLNKVDIYPKRGPAKTGELRNVVLNSVKAKVDLGWEPQTELADALADTVEWWVTTGKPCGCKK